MTCAKRKVTAVLVVDDRHFVGENSCESPQRVCPRGPGEGYAACKAICGQRSHAEVAAIKAALAAKVDLKRARACPPRMFLFGHTYACDDCHTWLAKYKIVLVVQHGGAENPTTPRQDSAARRSHETT
jgi:deoxycytidylate deaminase